MMIRFEEKYFAIGIRDVDLGLPIVSEQYTASVIHKLRLNSLKNLLYCPMRWCPQSWRSYWGYLGFTLPHWQKKM